MNKISVVMFDLGGVVCQFLPGRRMEKLTTASGASGAEWREKIWEEGFLKAGVLGKYTAQEMYRSICQMFLWKPTYEEFRAMWASAYEPDESVLEIVEALHHQQIRTGILTNNPALMRDALQALFPEVEQKFDPIFFSYQFQISKPNPNLFIQVVRQLKVPAEEIIFIDDTEKHVKGANSIGIHGIHFTDAATLWQQLDEFIPLARKN